MSMVIGTNISSITAQRSLAGTRAAMETSMERLASGNRINSAMDDSAGLAIAGRMTAQIEGNNMAIRNANDGISMMQMAEGALAETSDILNRMRELSVQAASSTASGNDRAALDTEFDALKAEITRISDKTLFNGIAVLNSTSAQTFQVGANALDTLAVTLKDMDAVAIGNTSQTINETGDLTALTAAATTQVTTFTTVIAAANTGGAIAEVNGNTYQQDFVDVGADAALKAKATWDALGVKVAAGESTISAGTADNAGVVFTLTVTAGSAAVTTRIATGGGVSSDDITTQAGAVTAIGSIDDALLEVAVYRSDLGAVGNRLGHSVDNLMNRVEHHSSARSQIMDADFATESANLAKAQVLQQAGTAMLAQANASGQGVLSLLK
jgi:flagellin